MSASHDDPAGAATAPAGPVEAEVLAELARVPGGLAVELTTTTSSTSTSSSRSPGASVLRVLRGGGGASAAGAPDAETVVLLHGRGHAASIWFPCWRALAARHRLLAIDLPGFGASTMASGGATGRGAEGALRVFVDPIESWLAAEVDAGRAPGGLALVGHSLGGLVALELALRARVPVRRLVIIDGMGLGPAMTLASRLFFRLHPERLSRWLGARLFGRINPSPPTPLGRRIAALELELLGARAAGRARARAAAARAFDRLCPLVGPVFHRQDRLPRVTAPTLLLWGQRDAALPLANAASARDHLSAARLLTFPLGHSPHLEAPEVVLPPLLHFLSIFLAPAAAGG